MYHMFTSDSVSIITAATGHKNLLKCLRSVQGQTFPSVTHFVVSDGQERSVAVHEAIGALRTAQSCPKPVLPIELPHPTGRDNWCGHRIYGAMSFLINSEFVSFLDEDNWLESCHVERLVASVRASGATWAFALRNIVDESGAFLTRDDCESLGNLHPVFDRPDEKFVDTNCYLLPREIAVAVAGGWYGPTRPAAGRMEPDRFVASTLFSYFPDACSSKAHTVNYAVSSREDSVTAEYFRYGNARMRERYPDGMPWASQ